MSSVEAIQQSLAAGDVSRARALTEDFIGGPGDEHGRPSAIGTMLQSLYADFVILPVIQFVQEALPTFDDSIRRGVLEEIGPDLELTAEWQKRLGELADERLTNELIEQVKASNMTAAADAVLSLLGSLVGDQRLQRARYIGYSLGGLVHERERATALVKTIAKAPDKFSLDLGAVIELDQEFQKSIASAARRERPVAATARVNLTQAIVELSRSLPQRNALHEPTPEDRARFDTALRAIVRCCLMSHAHNAYHEATLLFVEFSAKEVSSAGALAGIEQRLFATLGRTARTVSADGLAQLGNHPVVFKTYYDFARKHIGEKTGKYLAETLGLFKNPAAVPFLIDSLNNPRLDLNSEAIFALGTIADEKAQKALLHGLQVNLGGKTLEAERRRDVNALIGAIARAARQQEPATRSRLIAHVIKAIPKNDTELGIRVALSFFTGKLETLEPVLLDWAAKVATIALWNIDRPELARAARNSPLGFRQPLLDLLQRLAPVVMPSINAMVMEQAKSYNGAYLAVAELYSKVPDPSALPVLRQMLLNTFLYDDTSPKSAYQKETVLDTATDERTELSVDRVRAALVYAVDKIGGDEALDILDDLYEQIQTGRLPKPGPETSDILVQAHMRIAQKRGTSAFERGPAAADGEPGGEHEAESGPNDLQLLRQLDAKYLLQDKRRKSKVLAMQQLAKRRFVQAIPSMISHLADKDPIVSSAAMTALSEFGSSSAPQQVVARLHEELFNALQGSDNVLRVKVAEMLKRLNPKRSPLKERLEEFSKEHLPLPARAVVTSLIALSKVDTAPAVAPGGDGKPAAAGGPPVSALDKKRAFMLARQEWIKNGKRGPEPRLE